MELDEIKELWIPQVADPNSICFLWYPDRHTRSAYEVLDAWGFKPVKTLVWDKIDPSNANIGKARGWLRTEFCLVGIKGRPALNEKELAKHENAGMMVEKKREHSRKPECFYELVERIAPGSKLEVFSQKTRSRWTGWGDQATKYDYEHDQPANVVAIGGGKPLSRVS
jgi:N6-adenosine-specific RNA methylase IME4